MFRNMKVVLVKCILIVIYKDQGQSLNGLDETYELTMF